MFLTYFVHILWITVSNDMSFISRQYLFYKYYKNIDMFLHNILEKGEILIKWF